MGFDILVHIIYVRGPYWWSNDTGIVGLLSKVLEESSVGDWGPVVGGGGSLV